MSRLTSIVCLGKKVGMRPRYIVTAAGALALRAAEPRISPTSVF